MSYAYYDYEADNGLVYAATLRADRAALMHFAVSPLVRPKLPHGLKTRKEVFINATGQTVKLPYPTVTPPYSLGTVVSYRGDNWTAFETLDEIGSGAAT